MELEALARRVIGARGVDKVGTGLWLNVAGLAFEVEKRIPPLRCAPVGMTGSGMLSIYRGEVRWIGQILYERKE